MTDYYQRVAEYFDEDAAEFDARYWRNPALQRIRQAFREEVTRHPFGTALEVGCGTGLDLCHFGLVFPTRRFFGVDISPRMVQLARAKVAERNLANVSVAEGSVEHIPQRFPRQRFDLVYVFFGALNTVRNLTGAADALYDVTAPGGVLILSVVNRWYIADMLENLLRGRIGRAWQRLGHAWGGYSPVRRLETRCYGPGDVAGAFGREGMLVRRRGVSILYPPWYRPQLLRRLRRVGRLLWEVDHFLSRTPLWSLGEYALYVYRRRRALDVTAGASAWYAPRRADGTRTASLPGS